MGRQNVNFVPIGYIPSTLSGNPHISRQHPDQEFNLEPPKLRLCQITKNISDKIVPHISSALRDLGVILINIFHLEVPYWRLQTVNVL